MNQADWSTDKKDWCCKEHDACLQKNIALVLLLYSGGWMIGTAFLLVLEGCMLSSVVESALNHSFQFG